MKIIHTSDWHIGHSFFDFERYEEHTAALSQLAEIVEQERPDALLVSGDIFHSYTPSSKARRLFVEAIEEIRQRCDKTQIIVTAGNHDNAAYHEVFSMPWRRSGIHLVGTYTGDVDSLIINLPGKGFIGAVPYVPARRMAGLYDSLMARINELNVESRPVVLMGHLAVSGCKSTGHDDDGQTIGNIDCMPIVVLSEGYDYAALGHIHRPQTFKGTSVRYSGSLLLVSFDETWSHSVSIVEIHGHGSDASISEHEIRPVYEVVTLEGTWTEVYNQLKALPKDHKCYIRLKVFQSDSLPYNADKLARDECDGDIMRFCTLQYERVAQENKATEQQVMSVATFANTSPVQIAEQYATLRGFVFDSEMKRLLSAVLDKIDEEERYR